MAKKTVIQRKSAIGENCKTSLDFNYVKPYLDLLNTLTPTINFMARDFDDLALSYL